MSAGCAALAKLERRMEASHSLLCVGLDPVLSQLPERFQREPYPMFRFCREVIDQTADSCCAFKPNTAFFEAHGARGWDELARVFAYLREAHPELMTIPPAERQTKHGK